MIFLDFYWTTHPPDRSNLQFSIGQFFIKSIFVRESGQNLHTFCHAMCVLATVRIVYLEQKISTLSYLCITFYTVLDGKMHYMVVYFQFADSRYRNISFLASPNMTLQNLISYLHEIFNLVYLFLLFSLSSLFFCFLLLISMKQ